MSKLSFTKYEGLGNDFILIDDRDEKFLPTPALIRQLCDRKFGIGADGLILLQNPFRMRIFNCDGSEPASCGNGLRCFVHFLRELGFSQETFQIQTQNQIVTAKWIDGQVAVNMGIPTQLNLNIRTEEGIVHFVDSGVPHVVQFVPEVEKIDLARVGPLLRHHPLFSPNGANVNFAQMQEDGSVRVRTFERGVERETLACGTGATAVAFIMRQLYGFEKAIPVYFPGGMLVMEGSWMRGPACRVFSGHTIEPIYGKTAHALSAEDWRKIREKHFPTSL